MILSLFIRKKPEVNFLQCLSERIILVSGHSGRPLPYSPESSLANWFKNERDEDIVITLINTGGVVPVKESYQKLCKMLKPDALILVDGGVDLMRGDEESPGSLLEDSISLAAIEHLGIPIKILTCVGFGTELPDSVCHYHVLQNMATLVKNGGFLGNCALLPQMESFRLYQEAVEYAENQPKQSRSHINEQIIAAARGIFGIPKYADRRLSTQMFISPLMNQYWVFNALTVIHNSLLIPKIQQTTTLDEVLSIFIQLQKQHHLRTRRNLYY